MTGEETPLVALLRRKLGDEAPWGRLTKKARREYREAADAVAAAAVEKLEKEVVAVLIEAIGGEEAWKGLKKREGVHWSIDLPTMVRAIMQEVADRYNERTAGYLGAFLDWARDLLDEVGELRPDGKLEPESLASWDAGEMRRIIGERVGRAAESERHLADVLRWLGEAYDELAVPNEGRVRSQLPSAVRALRERAEEAESKLQKGAEVRRLRKWLEKIGNAAWPQIGDEVYAALNGHEPPESGLRRVVRACLVAPTGGNAEKERSFLHGALRRALEGMPVAICAGCGPQNGVVGKCSMCGGPTEVVGEDLAPPNPWEPQPHGEWGDWALPAKKNESRPFVSRLPNGDVSFYLEGANGGPLQSKQFTRGEWAALVAIADGRIKGRWEGVG